MGIFSPPDLPSWVNGMKRVIRIVLATGITIAAVWLSFRGTDIAVLRDAFVRANYLWVAGATAITLFTVYALGWRWRILLGHQHRVPMKTLFRLNIISQFANILVPARAGELVRAFMTARISSASNSFVLGTIVIERLFDIMIFAIFWIMASAFFLIKVQSRSGLVFGIGGGLLALAVLIVLVVRPMVFLHGVRFIARVLPRRLAEKITKSVEEGIRAFAVLRSPRKILVLSSLTVALLFLQVLANVLLFKAIPIRLPLEAALVVLLAVQIGSIPPSAPGKIGVFEYSVILALSLFNVSRPDALSYGLMLHIVAFLPKIVLGLAFLGFSKNRTSGK